MSLHSDTVDALISNSEKFSQELNRSIQTIVNLIDNYSALSDANYLLFKSGTSLPAIRLPGGEGSWLPIRNLARLVAKVATFPTDSPITSIQVDSMHCGCDYFEGNITLTVGERELSGAYTWQWTAFPGRERSYDKFTVFPELSPEIFAD